MKYKSINRIMTTLCLLTTIMFLVNCAAGIKKDKSDRVEMEAEFEAIKADILAAGGVAEVGISRMTAAHRAKDAAIANAQKNLAQIFEVNVQNLTKKFEEELGEDEDVEVNEAFSSATKSVTKQKLNFAIAKKTDYLEETVNGKKMYTCYVLMAIEPSVVNESFMDELKNKNKKTYERFRASEAYKELENEIEKYETKYNDENR